LHGTAAVLRIAVVLAGFVACASPGADDQVGDGKDDRGTSSRFVEIDPTHTNTTFRTYIHKALDELSAKHIDIAKLTLSSIGAGYVRIDELSDLTCADYLRVLRDLPSLGYTAADYTRLKERGSPVTAAIANELDGYMWSNRIYVSRGQEALRLAATLVHEVNHVINRSEVGYYDNLPTSAFLHEYRAFYVERLFDPAYYGSADLVSYVIDEYELDRTKITASVLESPLTPKLLPDATAWRERRVEDDVEEPADCSP
jgi:hypothetical protein